jgi:hypothetical protein
MNELIFSDRFVILSSDKCSHSIVIQTESGRWRFIHEKPDKKYGKWHEEILHKTGTYCLECKSKLADCTKIAEVV